MYCTDKYLKKESQHECECPKAEAWANLLSVDALVRVQASLLFHLLQLEGNRKQGKYSRPIFSLIVQLLKDPVPLKTNPSKTADSEPVQALYRGELTMLQICTRMKHALELSRLCDGS